MRDQKTFAGRKFYRSNHGTLKKDCFFEEYYRILHSAYLNPECSCIDAIQGEFLETFGKKPDIWSLSFICDTGGLFASNRIAEDLKLQGKIGNLHDAETLILEIGFDVWLMQTVEQRKQRSREEFYRWLPLTKCSKWKKRVKSFWKDIDINNKQLSRLYDLISPYKEPILMTYRRLLLENEGIEFDSIACDSILSYIENFVEDTRSEQEIAQTITKLFQEEIKISKDAIKDEGDVVSKGLIETITSEVEVWKSTMPEEEFAVTADTSSADTTSADTTSADTTSVDTPSVDTSSVDTSSVDTSSVETSSVDTPSADTSSVPLIIQSEKNKDKPHPVTYRPTPVRGFKEERRLTKKKLVTCAVCVAAAGVLLVPLITYGVMKSTPNK